MFRTLWATQLTDYKDSDVEAGLGQIRISGSNFYAWVKNNSALNFALGQNVYHKAADGVDLRSYVYDRNTAGAANAALLAGVAMSAIPATKFGWIQVWGDFASILCYASGGTAIAAGDILKGSAATTTNNGLGAMEYDRGNGDSAQTQEALTDSTGGATTATLAAQAALTMATTTVDETGGESSSTFASIAATGSYLQADITAIKNALAFVAQELPKIYADINGLKSAQANYVASLAARLTEAKADVATLITGEAQQRNIIALEALASSVAGLVAKRGFIRCL